MVVLAHLNYSVIEVEYPRKALGLLRHHPNIKIARIGVNIDMIFQRKSDFLANMSHEIRTFM